MPKRRSPKNWCPSMSCPWKELGTERRVCKELAGRLTIAASGFSCPPSVGPMIWFPETTIPTLPLAEGNSIAQSELSDQFMAITARLQDIERRQQRA